MSTSSPSGTTLTTLKLSPLLATSLLTLTSSLHLYKQIEDSSIIYALSPSPLQVDLTSLGGTTTFLPAADFSTVPVEAPILSIHRVLIAGSQRAAFEGEIPELERRLREHTAPYPIASGWSEVGSGGGGEAREWLAVLGFEKVSEQAGMSKLKVWEEYVRIKGMVASVDVKHARSLALRYHQ